MEAVSPEAEGESFQSPHLPGISIPGREFMVDPAHHLHFQLSPYWDRLENSMFDETFLRGNLSRLQ